MAKKKDSSTKKSGRGKNHKQQENSGSKHHGSLTMVALLLSLLVASNFTSTRDFFSQVQTRLHQQLTDSATMLTALNALEQTPDTIQRQHATSPSTNKRHGKPLNVVVLYPDDMRHDSLSAAGTQPVLTPFLDRLAQGGIRFVHNCVTTSICWISRATLFTGQYVSRHQAYFLYKTGFYEEWNTSWPYLLQQEGGYFVGHVGKWQYRDRDGFVARVFDWSRIFEKQHWYSVNGKRIHATDYAEQSTLDFLRERPPGQPFAVTVAFYPPKAIRGSMFNPKPESEALYANVTIPALPYNQNASYAKLPKAVFHEGNAGRTHLFGTFGSNFADHPKQIKNMYRMITEVDAACSRIVEELNRTGVLNETLVIFTSDNGMLHGEHGLGGKWFPWEENIRVPLIVHDPRMPASKIGTLHDAFTLNIDLAPTILAAANIDPPLGMQGRNFAELYLGEDDNDTKQEWRDEFYYEHPNHGPQIPQSSALVRKDFKYIRYDDHQIESLFNLKDDTMELDDVINQTQYRETVQEMRRRWAELKEEVAKPPPYTGITV